MEKIKNLKLKKKPNWKTVVAILLFILLGLAPFFMPMFRVNLLSKYMCFIIVAIGLDMIWGYTGILSLGHGVYFGIGAYCMAMYLKLESANGGLPDFMSWSGLTSLPSVWKPFQSTVFTMVAIIIIPAVVAIVIGYLTFLNRIKGVYFSILSQALAMILSVLLIGMQAYSGGSNGLTNFTTVFGANINSNLTKFKLFYITLITLILVFCICKSLTDRRIGKVLIAIRDGENRARFVGYDPAKYKVFVYAISAVIAGIAGALYVTQVGIISPVEVGITPSIEMVIWVAIGGKGTLVGPMIGALSVNGLKTLVSESFPAVWSYFIGFVFIIVILWLPGGIISIKDIPKKIKMHFTNGKPKKGMMINTEKTQSSAKEDLA